MKKVKLISILIIINVLLTSCNIAKIGSKPTHSVRTTKRMESETITKPEDTIETTIESITEPDTKEQTETEEITEPPATSQIEPPNTIEPIIPDQSYVGSWTIENNNYSSGRQFGIDLSIYEITPDYIIFDLGLFRTMSVNGVAVLQDGEFIFGDGISLGYHAEGLQGRIKFGENSVTFIFDSFGVMEHIASFWGYVHEFTIRKELSVGQLEKFNMLKESLQNLYYDLQSSYE